MAKRWLKASAIASWGGCVCCGRGLMSRYDVEAQTHEYKSNHFPAGFFNAFFLSRYNRNVDVLNFELRRL